MTEPVSLEVVRDIRELIAALREAGAAEPFTLHFERRIAPLLSEDVRRLFPNVIFVEAAPGARP